jgi:hypothetical protein
MYKNKLPTPVFKDKEYEKEFYKDLEEKTVKWLKDQFTVHDFDNGENSE